MGSFQVHEVALVGHGYWGSKIADRIERNKRFNLKYIVDENPIDITDPRKLSTLKTALEDPKIEMVGVFLPPHLHGEFIRRVLESGKHAYTTKPFVLNTDEAKELLELADSCNRRVFVDYTYLFSPVIEMVKQQLDFSPILIEFANANRWTGRAAPGVSPITDLIPHIVSILYYLYDSPKITVDDVCNLSVASPNDMSYIRLRVGYSVVNITVGWAYPWKERRNIIIGREKMITFDTSAVVKVQHISYDGVKINTDKTVEHNVGGEPLQREIDAIADALEGAPFVAEGSDMMLPYHVTRLTNQIEAFDFNKIWQPRVKR